MSALAHSSIMLAGQVLQGRDHYGDWRVNKMDGWFQSPGVKGPAVERQNADGEYDLPSNRTARFITLSGRVLCQDPAQTRRAANRLTGLLQAGVETMQVTDAGGTTWAKVKLNGPTEPVKVNDRMLRFQFDLKAPDPRRYGEQNAFRGGTGEAITTFHRGNYGAHPLIYINGSMPGGYRLTCNGQTVTVPVPAVQDVWHRIDFRLRRLRVGGSVVLAAFTDNQFWTNPPGAAFPVVITPLGGGSGVATINVTDTYI